MKKLKPTQVISSLFILFLAFIFSNSVLALESKVSRVIDGDTIQLESGEKVRYIGVDTPETSHPYKVVEEYGREASLANKNLVDGKTVRLEFDVQQKDEYGRLLAYVYVGDIFVNAWLIENGFAKIATYPPNVKYQDLFVKLDKQARELKKGLWSDENNQKTTQVEQKFLASKKSNKFHLSNCPWAQKISPSNLITFGTVEEATGIGYIPCKVCKPVSNLEAVLLTHKLNKLPFEIRCDFPFLTPAHGTLLPG